MNAYAKKILRCLMAAAALGATASVHAETYPGRDITFIVPYGPGGSTDPISRQFAGQLEKILSGNINVENKPGGTATIGTGAVVRAKPDGYTIGLGSNGSLTYQPQINSGLAYKTPDDYQPIVKLVDQPAILFVRADAPWKTFEEFMADAKKNPGKLRVSTSGSGSTNDLVVKQLNKVAGVKIATVPFTGGGGEATVALLGGRVEGSVGYGISALGFVQSGKARVLAVFKKGKYDLFPDATPVADLGYDATLPAAYYVLAPKGLPKDVLDKLVSASQKVVRSEEYIKFAKSNGYVVDPKGPEEVRAELVQYGKTFAELIKFINQK
jgi:tripartite-type tricarboxylate transporter receptor subunit TctC